MTDSSERKFRPHMMKFGAIAADSCVGNCGECRLVGVDESAEAREMDFEELLDRACESASLPEMARLLLPSTLSVETKDMVLKLSPEELGAILKAAIDKINRGSVESVDGLVRRQLGK